MAGLAVHIRARTRSQLCLVACAAGGLAASVLIALSGPRLVDSASTPWWYRGPIGAHSLATALMYLGIALLVFAWLGLGALVSHAPARRCRMVLGLAGLWTIPLLVGPALFSHDMYSYLAQGTLYRLGVNPYTHAPSALAALGQHRLLATVDPFWLHTTAPYGPLFIAICGLVSLVWGSHLVAAICTLRAIELIGLLLGADGVVRIARARGSDGALGCWLVCASPLTLLELVAPGHNDALMIGLVAEAVAAMLAGRTELAATIGALATTIKPAAAIAVVFVLVLAWRSEKRGSALRATGCAAAVLIVISAATSLRASWLTASVLSVPGKVLLAITPSSALAEVVHLLDGRIDARALSTTISRVALGLCAVVIVVLCARVSRENLPVLVGVGFVLVTLAGPAAWPWYYTWGLVLLAECTRVQRSRALVLGVVASAFVMKPSGTLALPITAAPEMLALGFALVVVALRYRRATGPARLG